jgi:hypothetical protein
MSVAGIELAKWRCESIDLCSRWLRSQGGSRYSAMEWTILRKTGVVRPVAGIA